jgi:hypothetical protein
MKSENFAGAGAVLVVNSRMTNRVVLGVAAFLSLCFSLGAEQPARALSLAQLNSLASQSSRPLFFQPAVFSKLGDPLLTDGAPGPATFSGSRETFGRESDKFPSHDDGDAVTEPHCSCNVL